ncbi:hypothetical protein AB0R99_00115 [Erwinia amylovora]|uniref:hypothetical protein n=1 Tax=Erwinia amylovora TaxID=552 RepID=UPI0037DC3C11
MSKTTQEQLNRIKNAKTIEEAYIILSNLEKPYYLQYKIDTKKIYNTRMSLSEISLQLSKSLNFFLLFISFLCFLSAMKLLNK